jgi:hypothetical protein
MKRLVAGVPAVILAASFALSFPAQADSTGAAIAAGIGGAALGAIVGGSLAQAQPAPPVYYAPPAPVYVEEHHCWRERRPDFDEYGEVIGFRPRRVCDCSPESFARGGSA